MTDNAQEIDDLIQTFALEQQVLGGDFERGAISGLSFEMKDTQLRDNAKQAILDWRDKAVVEARNELLDALENHKKTLDYIVIDGAPRNPTNYEVYMKKALEVDTKIAKLEAEL